jgi:hypothetical protein
MSILVHAFFVTFGALAKFTLAAFGVVYAIALFLVLVVAAVSLMASSCFESAACTN